MITNLMKIKNMALVSLGVFMLAGSAFANPGDKVVGSYYSGKFGSSNELFILGILQSGKEAAVKDAMRKCNSKVRQLALFTKTVNRIPNGTSVSVLVTAPFECIVGEENDVLLTDKKDFLLPTIAQAKTHPAYRPGIIRHFVSFKFKAGTSDEQIQNVKERFLALKQQCLRNGAHYIKSIETGYANSFEGADEGKQIAFLVTFQSEGDRNYYVGQPLISDLQPEFYDAKHLEFKKMVGPLLETSGGAFVFDYRAGNE